MAFDAHKNLAISTVAIAPSPALSGTTLSVVSGQGARFPAVPFNALVYPADTTPTPANGEIIRVTNIAGDGFTITRTQEGTSARAILAGDKIAATITVKSLTDIEAAVASGVTGPTGAAGPTGVGPTGPTGPTGSGQTGPTG